MENYLADRLFVQHQVVVKFGSEYARNDSKYLIVFCKVKKRDSSRFLDALADLSSKMLLFGYTDYEEQCSRLMNFIEDASHDHTQR